MLDLLEPTRRADVTGDQTPVHTREWPAALYVLGWSDFVRCDPNHEVLVDSRATGSAPGIGTAAWLQPLDRIT